MDEREDFTTSQREGLPCPRLPHKPEMGRGVVWIQWQSESHRKNRRNPWRRRLTVAGACACS